ncbi:hypothetical protein DL93DRAFT_2081867 [Clavulina sp. PMI_390]|nr:hypothetical protein DL93DRAFT_2081867 [Clavulina sp. PMI_390]
MELQLAVNKLTLSSAHDLSLTAARLLERIGRMGVARSPLPPETTLKPRMRDGELKLATSTQSRSEINEGRAERSSPVVDSVVFEQGGHSYRLGELDDLPLTLSQHL